MKKKFLIALCFYLLLYPLSTGGSEEKKEYVLDGYEWANFTAFEKIGFVKGWIAGGTAAFGALFNASFAMEHSGLLNRETFYQRLEIIDSAMKENGVELDFITFGQIVETIDSIYSDPRVKQWEILKIMPIVRGRLKVGWTQKDVDEVIAYYVKYNEWKKKFENFSTMNEIQRKKVLEEDRSIESSKPKVLKVLESYKKDRKEDAKD